MNICTRNGPKTLLTAPHVPEGLQDSRVPQGLRKLRIFLNAEAFRAFGPVTSATTHRRSFRFSQCFFELLSRTRCQSLRPSKKTTALRAHASWLSKRETESCVKADACCSWAKIESEKRFCPSAVSARMKDTFWGAVWSHEGVRHSYEARSSLN